MSQFNEVDTQITIALELEEDLDLFCGEIPRWSTTISALRSAHYRCPAPDNEHLGRARLHIDLVLAEWAQLPDYWDGFSLSYSLAAGSMFHSDIGLMRQAAEHIVQRDHWVESANEALNPYECCE